MDELQVLQKKKEEGGGGDFSPFQGLICLSSGTSLQVKGKVQTRQLQASESEREEEQDAKF